MMINDIAIKEITINTTYITIGISDVFGAVFSVGFSGVTSPLFSSSSSSGFAGSSSSGGLFGFVDDTTVTSQLAYILRRREYICYFTTSIYTLVFF